MSDEVTEDETIEFPTERNGQIEEDYTDKDYYTGTQEMLEEEEEEEED